MARHYGRHHGRRHGYRRNGFVPVVWTLIAAALTILGVGYVIAENLEAVLKVLALVGAVAALIGGAVVYLRSRGPVDRSPKAEAPVVAAPQPQPTVVVHHHHYPRPRREDGKGQGKRQQAQPRRDRPNGGARP